MIRRAVLLLTILLITGQLLARDAPRSIPELRLKAPAASFVSLSALSHCDGFRCQLLTYQSENQEKRAIVGIPSGFQGQRPVLIANHGYHPQPRNYGKDKDGQTARPGEYYREAFEAYVRAGFIVVLADYRGHNDSQGFAYTQSPLARAYYTQDVVSAVSLLHHIKQADLNRVVMWGHSLGGEVTLRALLALEGTPVNIAAASLWSSVGGSLWDQAYYYATAASAPKSDSWVHDKDAVEKLRDTFAQFPDLDWPSIEPLNYIDQLSVPLVIHHSEHDTGANYDWSRQLASTLYRLKKNYVFYTYEGQDHLFRARQFELAVERDIAFFKSYMPDVP